MYGGRQLPETVFIRGMNLLYLDLYSVIMILLESRDIRLVEGRKRLFLLRDLKVKDGIHLFQMLIL